MYVCMCNPFTDKDVKKHFEENALQERVKMKDVYKACSGGEDMNCGTCACALQEMVTEHNNAVIVSELSDQIKPPKPASKELV